jgi:hypothetical protein
MMVARNPASAGPGVLRILRLKRFQAKWVPVRGKKTSQNEKLEPRSDAIVTEKALDAFGGLHAFHFLYFEVDVLIESALQIENGRKRTQFFERVSDVP